MTSEKRYTNEEIAEIYSVKNRKLPDDLVKQANSVNILDYIEKKGLTLQKSHRNTYQLAEHDSLKITPSENVFNWYSRNEGGYGAVGFARVYYGMDFRSAVRDVMENADEMIEAVERPAIRQEDKEPYVYNRNQMSEDTSKAEDYLINKRKLDKVLVERLVAKGMVRQSKEHDNAVFMWHKNGEIIGHEERGTGEKKFQKIAEGVPENRGFSVTFGKPENLFVFESSIDALSYASIYPPVNSRFISLNGLKSKTMYQAIADIKKDTGKLPENIVICVDNDKGGKNFRDKYSAEVFSGEDVSTMYHSIPPAFMKNEDKETKTDIIQTLKFIDKENIVDLNIKLNNEAVKQNENGNFQFTDSENIIEFDGKSETKRLLEEKFKDAVFEISYKETTKDWNEVLVYLKENNLKELERPLVKIEEEFANPEMNKEEQKNTSKKNNKNEEVER